MPHPKYAQLQTCPVCQRAFEVPRRRLGVAKYCSNTCQGLAMRTKVLRDYTCEYCGKSFQRNVIAKDAKRFCSKRCNGLAIRLRLTRTCEYCGNKFEAEPNQIRNKGGRFCSHACYSGARMKGELRSCMRCQKPFVVSQGYLRKGGGRFCTRECFGLWYSGPNNNNWRGGIAQQAYPKTFNAAFKRMIRERDNYRCARCGAPNSTDVHHIDAVKANTTPENCITLCDHCHGKCISKRMQAHWLYLYREIMTLKAWGTRHKAQIAV